jgi:cyclase
MRPHVVGTREMEERPLGYLGPNLNPEGLRLIPTQLGTRVYALLANRPPADNNGLVIGTRCALLVDAGINGAMSTQLQSLAAELSPVPLRYIANTTYHGDHTFGNYAFPDEVVICSSYQNKASMSDLEREKRIRSGNLRGNTAAIEDVRTWRKPDITFDRFLEIDLGDEIVELWHFGQGNAPGDTVVYVPSAKVAFTGNYLPRAHIGPMLLEGSPGPYIESLARMKQTLDVKTIVPGHGPIGDAHEAIDTMVEYLQWLQDAVSRARDDGMTVDEAVQRVGVPPLLVFLDDAPHADELNANNAQMHKLNVLAAYRALDHAGE